MVQKIKVINQSHYHESFNLNELFIKSLYAITGSNNKLLMPKHFKHIDQGSLYQLQLKMPYHFVFKFI
jgi:hypothetical protein